MLDTSYNNYYKIRRENLVPIYNTFKYLTYTLLKSRHRKGTHPFIFLSLIQLEGHLILYR